MSEPLYKAPRGLIVCFLSHGEQQQHLYMTCIFPFLIAMRTLLLEHFGMQLVHPTAHNMLWLLSENDYNIVPNCSTME